MTYQMLMVMRDIMMDDVPVNLGRVIARLKPLGEWDRQGGMVRRVWPMAQVSVEHRGAVQARPGSQVVVVPVLKGSPRPAVERSF